MATAEHKQNTRGVRGGGRLVPRLNFQATKTKKADGWGVPKHRMHLPSSAAGVLPSWTRLLTGKGGCTEVPVRRKHAYLDEDVVLWDSRRRHLLVSFGRSISLRPNCKGTIIGVIE